MFAAGTVVQVRVGFWHQAFAIAVDVTAAVFHEIAIRMRITGGWQGMTGRLLGECHGRGVREPFGGGGFGTTNHRSQYAQPFSSSAAVRSRISFMVAGKLFTLQRAGLRKVTIERARFWQASSISF